ncbi:MAG: tRNA pseudouridine(13) synthase TruD [Candidatus Micrarchaeota archaeon]
MAAYNFQPDEFVVEEISLDGTLLEVGKKIEKPNSDNTGIFCHFVLEKKLWNTAQALNAVARCLRGGRKRFNAAGTKDRNAITVQLCSVYGGTPEQLLAVNVKDIKINGAWTADNKVELGDLLGNNFKLILNKKNVGVEISAREVQENAASNNFLFPNYFGSQRFGSLRCNSHKVGKLMVHEKWQEAVVNYLTYTDENERNLEAVAARNKLAKELDFKAALNYFPGHLKFERTILGHLALHENDYIGALRKMPRHTLLLFLHAYQSYLFNELLRRKVSAGTLFNIEKGAAYCDAEPTFGFPVDEVVKIAEENLTEQARDGKVFPLASLIGLDTKMNDEEKELLESEGIKQEQFKLKSMPEMTSKGTQRSLIAPIAHFKILQENPVQIQFALPSGCYATVALDYILGKN